MPAISNLPTITGITAIDPTQTDAATVHYTVTFSKPVIGVAADQFSLGTTSGISGAGITDVTPVAGSNGASYTVTVNTGSGSGTVALQFTGSNVHDSSGYYVGAFQSEATLNTSSPTSIAVGDVNGDGKLDIVMGASYFYTTNYITVALNDGTGHFSSTSNASAAGIMPLLSLADLNGDGKLDVAQVNADGTVKVRIGNGNGTFAAETNYSAGGAYQAPKVIDVTGDGVLDVVIGSTVLPGSGNGAFGTAITTNLGVGSIAYGDFNGDGKLDLVTRNTSTSAVALSFGNGNGTFQAPSAQVATATTVLTGDFNGDGKLDMATVTGSAISILLGNGDGSFNASGTLQAAAALGTGAVADVNGDGKADLVVVTSNNTLSTFYGHGDGTFGQVRVSPLDKTAGQIGVGDLNGDGKADILVGYQFGSNPFSQTSGTDILLSGPSNENGAAYTIVRSSPALAITDADVTLGTDGNNYINAAHLSGGATTLAGTGNAGDAITVTDAVTHAVVGTTTVGQDGKWSLGVSGLQDGTTYSYVTSATDSQGNSSVGPAFTFTVDATASLGVTNIDLSADAVSGSKVTFQGTTDTPAQVTVSIGGTDVLVDSSSGSWQFDSGVVPNGLTTFTAKFSDAAGNIGTSPTYTLVRGYYTLAAGTQFANAVVLNSFFTVSFNASENGAIVLSGAQEIVLGTSTGATIRNGGSQLVQDGKAYGALVQAGGTQTVRFQGSATDTVLYGTQSVGGEATRTIVKAGGAQTVLAGSHAYSTVIEASGSQITAGSDHDSIVYGTQYVTGHTWNATIGAGGVQYDYGTSTGAIVQSGGVHHVYQGGADATTVAAGGYQDVYHASVTFTVLNGEQQVLDGGFAGSTVVNAGGRQYVGSGGSTYGSTIAVGGFQYVDVGAIDNNAVINGGWQYVAGSTSSASVGGRGELDVAAGATATNSHLDGGTEHVYAGGTAQNVDFSGSAGSTLVLDAPAGLAGTIANFGGDDYIDFRNTVISSVDIDSSNNLTVTTDGGQSYSWALLGQYAASSFVLASDGNGGTALSYVPQQQTLLAAAH
ncbi:beta strand repeat-containing protein [Bradyrhizobium betae]|uniref:Uncharacterized protein n=1 Tax=Bradyrhizobium betae TaxID=244734 RepID=A0A5P6P3F0_9BRAD|nr:FG-GAP-like repeat-containing protein [Bradyrhizobium betae]MCS3728453.1 autotransporter passenger strand-loop-strand repeat protein [Bradyrhizobium betae]QFI72879.1 hypothetical protein F8237_11000 [Bradyrhizobium betae]